MSQFESNNFPRVEIQKPELISDYRKKHKLPEVNPSKTKKLAPLGYAIEYDDGVILQVMDIQHMKINPEKLPVAISCLGSGENSPEQRAK